MTETTKLLTFREQVAEFWKWFPDIAEDVSTAIMGQDQDRTIQFFDERFVPGLKARSGGLAWDIGAGKSGDRLALTLSGQGQAVRQLLAKYWLSQALQVPGWEFFDAKQPLPADQLKDMAIEVHGVQIDMQSVMVGTRVDEDQEAVDIRVWHESLANLDRVARFEVLYPMLDHALGEFATQTKIGTIEFAPESDAIPLIELPRFLNQLWVERGWEERSPLETYSGYQAEPTEGFERADTISGYTCIPNVVLAFLNDQGRLDYDPLEGSGAQLAYVQIDRSHDDPNVDLEQRSKIEEEISKRLNGGGGYVVGGATGTEFSYIDVILFDGERSHTAVAEAVDLTDNANYEIKPFFR